MMDGRERRFIYASPLPAEAVDRSFMVEKRVSLPLKKFLAQPRLFHAGNWFTTAEICRFVANKLGGTHIDFDRSGQWEKLDAAHRYFSFGGPELAEPPTGSELYLVLEPQGKEVLSGLHLEIVAAAASFGQMSMNGEQLVTLNSQSSLLDRVRKLRRAPPSRHFVERKRN
jgi:hypothetical protein